MPEAPVDSCTVVAFASHKGTRSSKIPNFPWNRTDLMWSSGCWLRRIKMSQRLLQVDLLDAQARSSRVSMLLPGSLVLAETELRCSCRKRRLFSFVLHRPVLRDGHAGAGRPFP